MSTASGRGRVATHWGAYQVSVSDGEITGVEGMAQDGQPSTLGENLRGALGRRSRVLRPAVRRGWLRDGPGPSRARGREPFVEVPWDELVDMVGGELDRVRRRHGNRAIYGGSYGWASAGRFHHAQSQVHRFLTTLGGYTASVGTYSFAAEEVVLPHIVGDRTAFLDAQPRWPEVAEHCRFVLAFGGLPRRSVDVAPGGVGEHRNAWQQDECARAGVRFCVVGPSRSDTGPALGASWLPARPGTDAAVMLGMCHTLLVENRYDDDFVRRCCVGFDRVRDHLLGRTDGRPKDAEWAAAIADVPAVRIRELARRLAATRSLVTVTWSLQRQHHGEMTYWAAVTLAAMAGSMGRPGGGLALGHSSTHGNGPGRKVPVAAALPQGPNPVPDRIPVARVADMLLHPGDTIDFDGARLTYPDIRLVYWAGGNPFHHHQDLNRLLTAWWRPDTVVVHEPYWNATARHSDIVVPVATGPEREDIAMGAGDSWLLHSERVAPPPPGIRTDHEVFAALAARCGVEREFTEGREMAEWVRLLYDRTARRCAELGVAVPDFDTFRELGALELDLPDPDAGALARLRADPDRYPLRTPSGRIELFSATVDGFGYDDCPGQAMWLEPAEWLGGPLADRFPLHLVSPQPDGKLHSQLDDGPASRSHTRAGRTVLHLNDADARDRGITTGDVVEVSSPRGRCLATAAPTDDLRRGVVVLPTGSWYDPLEPGVPGTLDKHGNPNVLTPDIRTSRLAQGPAAHTCLVQVRRWRGPVPGVTAHEPPPLTG